MSRELERRLERLLGRPRASDEVEERALGLAVEALPPARAVGKRRLRALAVASAAALVLLALAAAALAAAGALHVSLGPSARHQPALLRPVAPELRVPAGATAVAAVVEHKLWLSTRSGLRIQGLPVQSAALSPHALYVAAGVGDSLVAMAPNGTTAWSHPAGGHVVALAWAPDGLRIAYIVRRGNRYELRTIEGNGIGDLTLDSGVRPVTPSWRADSLAVAYVGAGGRPVVYDFAHDSHEAQRTTVPSVRNVAFAPVGDALAVDAGRTLSLDASGRATRVAGIEPGATAGITWVRNRLIVASATPGSSGSVLHVFRISPQGSAVSVAHLLVPGRIEAIDGNDDMLVIAVASARGKTRLLASAAGAGVPLRQELLELPAGTAVETVSVR